MNKLILLFLLLIPLITVEVFSASKPRNYQVQNLKINKDKVYCISGNILNQQETAVSGYVKIKFLDENGDIKRTVATIVNDGNPFADNQSGAFEYWTLPKYFEGVENFEITFHEEP